MALQTTGPISFADINVELGVASTTTRSLNDTTSRTLAGVASGTISMSNFYGKSAAATFTPAGGTTAGTAVALSDFASGAGTASVTITCSESAAWSYTRSGTFGTPATGSQTATSITFSLTNGTNFIRSSTWTVSATAGSTTRYWTVELTNDGFA
jgi:hypothetical protein